MPKDIASPSQGAFCTSPATAVEETSNGWANRGAILKFFLSLSDFLQPEWVQILSDYAHRYWTFFGLFGWSGHRSCGFAAQLHFPPGGCTSETSEGSNIKGIGCTARWGRKCLKKTRQIVLVLLIFMDLCMICIELCWIHIDDFSWGCPESPEPVIQLRRLQTSWSTHVWTVIRLKDIALVFMQF